MGLVFEDVNYECPLHIIHMSRITLAHHHGKVLGEGVYKKYIKDYEVLMILLREGAHIEMG